MSIVSLLLVILIVALVLALINGGSFGYAPSGIVGILLIVLLILVLTGQLSI